MTHPLYRVAQVVTSRGWGGRERVPLLLAREFRRLGHPSEVWADPGTPTGREAVRMGLPLRPLRFKGYVPPAEWTRAAGHLRAFLPDIVQLHEGKDLWTLVPALRLAGSPARLVFSQHVGNARPKTDPLHRLLYGRVDLLLACSEVIRQNAVSTCPLPESKCRTAYAPVDLKHFKFETTARAKWRKKWKLGPKDFAAGFAARLTPGKGHERMLDLAEALQARMPHLRIKLAGGASPGEEAYAENLRAESRRRGLGKVLEFVGYVDAVPGFLSALDVALHPAKAEAFGMAVVEALACGRPVLALDGEGAGEILRDGRGETRGGRLLESDETESWAEALERLLAHPPERLRLSRQAPAVAARFSLDRFVQFHLNEYRRLIPNA